MFYRELRALKLETPGFVKINVYCGRNKLPYKGQIHDAVTEVHVACRWEAIKDLPPKEMVQAFCALLEDGAQTVIRYFNIAPATVIAQVAAKVQAEIWAPLAFGKPATQKAGGKLSAHLIIRAADSLEYSTVSVAIKKERTPLGELPVCTTLPGFDRAVENLEGLEWISPTQLRTTFAIYGDPDFKVFGRRNLDSGKFAQVRATDSKDRCRRSFTVDIPSE
ncbi:MAG: hypothetical protein ACREXP_21165 [Steroidobacteraceae bacterium]